VAVAFSDLKRMYLFGGLGSIPSNSLWMVSPPQPITPLIHESSMTT
jgi:hypothetical protein